MIKQVFDTDGYWEVTVYWNVNSDLFYIIEEDLLNIHFSHDSIDEVYYMLSFHKAKAVTCSSLQQHTSIVLFNYHGSMFDYINSIVHEAEHIKQAMLIAYNVEDKGEPPAYTIGYLVQKMYEAFSTYINANLC